MVVPARATSKTFLRASSMPFARRAGFFGLAVAEADVPVAVADDHEAAKENRRPPLTPWTPVHPDGALFVLCFGHALELQSFFAGGVGQDGDAAVVDEATASNTTVVMPASLARVRAGCHPLGAGHVGPPPPSSARSAGSVETPRPRSRRRGRRSAGRRCAGWTGSPQAGARGAETLARTRSDGGCAECECFEKPLLRCLSGLAEHALTRVAHALAL